MDKTHFSKCLRDAMIAADVRTVDAAKKANINEHTASNAVNGKVRPRKKVAFALSVVALNALNDRLREKLDDAQELRDAGNALRRAYIEEYERKEE